MWVHSGHPRSFHHYERLLRCWPWPTEPLDGLSAVCRFVVTTAVEVVAREGGEQHEAIIRQGATSARAESKTDCCEDAKIVHLSTRGGLFATWRPPHLWP